MARRRRRSNGSGHRFSRRRLLLLLGGSSILGGLVASTGAFSTVRTPRPTDVDVADDASALLGVSLAPYVDAGQSGENLVTITNNASAPLTVTVSLANASGTVSPTNPTLQPADSQQFTVDLSANATAGENALTIDISATDGSSMNINLSRTLGVRNFLRRLEDRTENTNALYYLSYRLQNMDNFQSYELIVENLGPSRDDLGTRTFTSTDVEHVFRIPSSGSDGNAEGDTYEFTMRIYDTNGLAIERVLTDVADGSDPTDNDDIGGGPEDPFVVDFTITDTTEFDNTHYTVDYQVDKLDNLKEVHVTFDNQSNNWSDVTVTSNPDSNGEGSVSYDEGGTEGDTYDITVETINNNDISTDSLTKTDVADGDDLGGGGGGCTIGSNVNPGTLQFNNLQGFEAMAGPDRWDISQIQVQDNDGDNDLNQLKLEISDSGGTARATRTTQLSGQQYQEQNIKINPDSGSYDVASGETYTLTATVCDADGNSLTETRQDTA